jgi:tRNA threonylcarbamoyladenosine biosynthesis protein TsaE
MPVLTIATPSSQVTQACGAALSPQLCSGDVLVLSGDLGAGKTQLTKGIAAGLGVKEPVTSPTFNILLVHSGRLELNHFDLYRLETANDLEDLDYWGTLESGGVSVVEWGDRFVSALPADGIVITIRIVGDEERAIEVEPLGDRGRQLAAQWAVACAAVEGARVEIGEDV